MQYTKRQSRAWIIAGICVMGLVLAVGGFYVFSRKTSVAICPYQQALHRPFIKKFFHDNWYWLVSEYSTDFSLDYILDNMVSTNHPEYAKPLTIAVLCKKNDPIGFIAYHLADKDEGKVLFVGVLKQERGHHHARRLLEHAFVELKKMGCKSVSLVTRTTNVSAQETYKAVGFSESGHENEFVNFVRVL